MYRNQKIALVIPAYNEVQLIRPTLASGRGAFDSRLCSGEAVESND